MSCRGDFFDINDVRIIPARHDKAGHIVLGVKLFIAHELQQLAAHRGLLEAHIGRVEPTDTHLFAHAIAGPRRAVIVAFDQGKLIAVRAIEQNTLFTETGVLGNAGNLEGCETVKPRLRRPCRDTECGAPHFADTLAATACVGEGKVGHDCTGRSCFVTIIEVIHIRCVKVHGLLHAAQTKHVGKEGIVLTGVTGQ